MTPDARESVHPQRFAMHGRGTAAIAEISLRTSRSIMDGSNLVAMRHPPPRTSLDGFEIGPMLRQLQLLRPAVLAEHFAANQAEIETHVAGTVDFAAGRDSDVAARRLHAKGP